MLLPIRSLGHAGLKSSAFNVSVFTNGARLTVTAVFADAPVESRTVTVTGVSTSTLFGSSETELSLPGCDTGSTDWLLEAMVNGAFPRRS